MQSSHRRRMIVVTAILRHPIDSRHPRRWRARRVVVFVYPSVRGLVDALERALQLSTLERRRLLFRARGAGLGRACLEAAVRGKDGRVRWAISPAIRHLLAAVPVRDGALRSRKMFLPTVRARRLDIPTGPVLRRLGSIANFGLLDASIQYGLV
jgi:hypothetical protein